MFLINVKCRRAQRTCVIGQLNVCRNTRDNSAYQFSSGIREWDGHSKTPAKRIPSGDPKDFRGCEICVNTPINKVLKTFDLSLLTHPVEDTFISSKAFWLCSNINLFVESTLANTSNLKFPESGQRLRWSFSFSYAFTTMLPFSLLVR